MIALQVDSQKLEALCRQYYVKRLSVFGSVLHGDNTPESDLDLLVEFDPNHIPGLKYFKLERELTELFGKKVDLNTAGFLSRYFRDTVVNSAEELYAS